MTRGTLIVRLALISALLPFPSSLDVIASPGSPNTMVRTSFNSQALNVHALQVVLPLLAPVWRSLSLRQTNTMRNHTIWTRWDPKDHTLLGDDLTKEQRQHFESGLELVEREFGSRFVGAARRLPIRVHVHWGRLASYDVQEHMFHFDARALTHPWLAAIAILHELAERRWGGDLVSTVAEMNFIFRVFSHAERDAFVGLLENEKEISASRYAALIRQVERLPMPLLSIHLRPVVDRYLKSEQALQRIQSRNRWGVYVVDDVLAVLLAGEGEVNGLFFIYEHEPGDPEYYGRALRLKTLELADERGVSGAASLRQIIQHGGVILVPRMMIEKAGSSSRDQLMYMMLTARLGFEMFEWSQRDPTGYATFATVHDHMSQKLEGMTSKPSPEILKFLKQNAIQWLSQTESLEEIRSVLRALFPPAIQERVIHMWADSRPTPQEVQLIIAAAGRMKNRWPTAVRFLETLSRQIDAERPALLRKHLELLADRPRDRPMISDDELKMLVQALDTPASQMTPELAAYLADAFERLGFHESLYADLAMMGIGKQRDLSASIGAILMSFLLAFIVGSTVVWAAQPVQDIIRIAPPVDHTDTYLFWITTMAFLLTFARSREWIVSQSSALLGKAARVTWLNGRHVNGRRTRLIILWFAAALGYGFSGEWGGTSFVVLGSAIAAHIAWRVTRTQYRFHRLGLAA